MKLGRKIASSKETDTSFKSKKVVIRAQSIANADLTVDQREALLMKLKNALVQVNHSNPSSRKAALVTLTDIVKHEHHLVRDEFSLMITGTLQTIFDKNSAVRKSYVSFMKQLVQSVRNDRLSSFFEGLVVRLRAALTHLDEEIQIDALSLLTVYLEITPQLIVKFDQGKLFPVFLQLLSPDTTRAGNHGTSSLRVSPHSSLGKSNGRLQILSSLYKYLHAQIKIIASKGANYKPIHFALGSTSLITTIKCPLVVDVVFPSFSSTDEDTDEMGLDSRKKVENVISQIHPLLIQIWVECSSSAFEVGRITDSTSLKIMRNALLCLSLIWKQYSQLSGQVNQIKLLKMKETMKRTIGFKYPFSIEEFGEIDNQVVNVLNEFRKSYELITNAMV